MIGPDNRPSALLDIVGGSSVLHLTLVTPSNGIICVIGCLSTADDMTPPCADFGAGRDGDDRVVFVLNCSVARKAAVIHILKRIVAGRGPDAFQLPLICPVHGHLLEDGVAADRSRKSENRHQSHCVLKLEISDLLGRWRTCFLLASGVIICDGTYIGWAWHRVGGKRGSAIWQCFFRVHIVFAENKVYTTDELRPSAPAT